jgi:hypothetical protein
MDSILPMHAPPPVIPPPPLAAKGRRPRYSVMVPTCEPDEKLCRALASVLDQAPSASDMQIAVVDDASAPGVVHRLVRSVDPEGRVEIVTNERRLGLGGNWNRAITLARGELVHLLHQDDFLYPDFYARLARGFDRAADIGMAFCRCRIVDADERLVKMTSRQRWLSGVLTNWLPTIAERQRIQTPSAVVARSTYETVGGYRGDLCHALDWEMWVRIAARYDVWYEPRALAAYRRHVANESTRLAASGEVWPDMARAIRIIAASLPAAMRRRSVAASVRWHVASAMRTAERQLEAGAAAAAADTLRTVPVILDLVGGDTLDLAASRRLTVLHTRLDHRRRRAA